MDKSSFPSSLVRMSMWVPVSPLDQVQELRKQSSWTELKSCVTKHACNSSTPLYDYITSTLPPLFLSFPKPYSSSSLLPYPLPFFLFSSPLISSPLLSSHLLSSHLLSSFTPSPFLKFPLFPFFSSFLLPPLLLLSAQEHSCILHSIIGWDCILGPWSRVEGSPNDPNPNDPLARVSTESLFNREGKLNPSITILGN